MFTYKPYDTSAESVARRRTTQFNFLVSVSQDSLSPPILLAHSTMLPSIWRT